MSLTINEELVQLRQRVKILEDENRHLKQMLSDAGIKIEQNLSCITESMPEERARLFYSYFWGRTDVYAKRYCNKKTGTSGYFPQCSNFWRYGICPKAERVKIQCKDCEGRSWLKLGPKQIEKHLRGEAEDCTDVIGVYPLFPDGTCRFLVFDFDNHNSGNDDLGYDGNDASWREEVNAVSDICRMLGFSPLVERSRSGKGAHVWLFFDKAIKASLARRFGFTLLDKGSESVNLKSFRFYDRMLPAQDELKAGGLGNLIALPLQGQAIRKGNSAFVDKDWNAYEDQWKALTDTTKITEDQINSFIEANIQEVKDTGGSEEQSKDKPWKRKSRFNKEDVDGAIDIALSNCIYVDKKNLKPKIQNQLRRLAALSNPSYFKNNAMGLSNFNNSRYIYMGYDDADYICIPRGLIEEIENKCNAAGIEINIKDERCYGRSINASFAGKLREEQSRAVQSVLDKDIGIISAATAFGKTVVCSNIIATKKVNTLILLESSALIEQWQKALDSFLIIDEEPPEYYTPTGRRKRRKSVIGLIQGAQDTSTGIIDIAMAGSLKKKGEFHNRIKDYGMIIVDECHHSASDTMSEVLMEVNAKYVYGVTATPFRGDGLEKINNMLLGPIRFSFTAKERAEQQGIGHVIIPRFTRVVDPHDRGKMHINDAYEIIRNSAVRNQQICDDIRNCVVNGRTPVVLTKYKDHAETLYEAVKNDADKVHLLTGSLSKKQQREIKIEMNQVGKDESLILIATGQLIGEGFDFPRLDTLIMATPVAWKGVVEQYAGRLNRDYPGKKDVAIYDYIDANIRVFDNMYAKRLKAYKRIGYSLQANTIMQREQLNAIYDYESYLSVYNNDMINAQRSIVISSPSMSFKKANDFVSSVKVLQERSVKITILTARPYSDNGIQTFKDEIIKSMTNVGIEVILQEENYQHFAVIDNSIVWYGSVNLLGKEIQEDNIMRVESEEIAMEILELALC